MDKLKTLKDLFEHQLKDLYSAENQLIDAMPKTASKTSNAKLKKALENHLEETKGQKERLEKIGEKLGISLEGETCKAMKGLIRETDSFIHEDADDTVKDAGIIADCQRIEHYEISGYGTARQYAKQLGHHEIADILNQTLEEEKDADEKLNDLAIEKINAHAMA